MTHRCETLRVRTPGRGLLEVTREVASVVARSGVDAGLCSVFCPHTSASLLLTENADPSARADLEEALDRLFPDGDPRWRHDAEGPDDMAAHLRSAVTRSSETIPVSGGRLLLGTWQGIFLAEHRTAPHERRLVVTVLGGPA